MGIGWTAFLEEFDSYLSQIKDSGRRDLFDEDTYINFDLGFAIARPEDWFFDEKEVIYQSRKGQRFQVPIDAETFILMTDHPLVVLSRDDPNIEEQRHHFSPGVTIFAKYHDVEKDGTFLEAYHDELLGLRLAFKGFEFLEAPVEINVSECRGMGMKARYYFDHEDLLSPVPVRVHALSVIQDPVVFDIKMYDSPFIGKEYEYDYRSFIESIRVV